jgi:hypothetical protein
MEKVLTLLCLTNLVQGLIAPEKANEATPNCLIVSLLVGPVFPWLSKVQKIMRRAGPGGAVRYIFPPNACPSLRFILSGLPDRSIKMIFWIGHIILLFMLLSLPYLVDMVPL